ncbi:uncharacterized protein LOC129779972 [Toxorhynchites rutilus septentrionalis]|uniref:uncharacterized protein LOC129779972 n=1 Tax=Toxorhynchites rutilus septentrionalis TaxID=329112 RepID=UPI0024790B21|nr:uncharacterized protein LOC129779972 [Toxorhynchites rutilus septentrionalis]
MAQNYINQLPVEAFYLIFDKLKIRDQFSAMRTCKLWYDILSSNRYIRKHQFNISVANLCSDVDIQVSDRMKRYPAYTISDALVPAERQTCFLEALQKFLSHEEVMFNVEDLNFEMCHFSLDDVFGSLQCWNFPNLRKISYSASVRVNRVEISHSLVKAPNLTKLQLEDMGLTISPFLQMFSTQIEELDVKFQDQQLLFSIIGSGTFTNLHSLTLSTASGFHFARPYGPYDSHDRYLQIFAQLKYLKICDDDSSFCATYKDIFQVAKNLETLIVHGTAMRDDSFNAIGDLKKLKELCLRVDIHSHRSVNKLSLPLLEKMSTYVDSFVPFESAPKLKRLCIENEYIFKVSARSVAANSNLIRYLRIINQQLEELHLKEMVLENPLINQICALKKLTTLKLTAVNVKEAPIYRILSELPQLEYCRFRDCNVETRVSFDNVFGRAREENAEDKENMDLFKKLELMYPHCLIESDTFDLSRDIPDLFCAITGLRPELSSVENFSSRSNISDILRSF